jgi:hypothetical protein
MAMKLTDNMKFLLGFVVYIAYASWWASGVSAGVHQNAKVSAETLVVLKDHMEECGEMHEKVAGMQQNISNNKQHIQFLEQVIFEKIIY